jgi:hypothetical protein
MDRIRSDLISTDQFIIEKIDGEIYEGNAIGLDAWHFSLERCVTKYLLCAFPILLL